MLWYTVVCITALFVFLGLSLRIKKIQIGKKNYKIPEVEKSKNLVERKAMALKETAKNFMK